MIHPDTELRFIDEAMGYGVFATKKIPQGTVTWALDKFDKVYSPLQAQTLEPIYRDILDKYSYRNSLGEYVLCWDFGRYVNHSFNSNCFSTGYDFEIAIRNIEPGEELTNDYGYLNLEEPFEGRPENAQRKIAYPDDLLTYHTEWDNVIRNSFPLILKVDQPLWPLLPPDLITEISEVTNGQREMKSILTHYFAVG